MAQEPKSQKIFLTILTAISAFGGFEALAYILNLNQFSIFLTTSIALYLYLVFKLVFDFHLHYKDESNRPGIVGKWGHLLTLRLVGFWCNYLLLPSHIYWATVIMIYLDFGFIKYQQLIIWLSGLALTLNYWYIKEIFNRHKEKVDQDLFVRMTVLKIFAAGITYAAAIAILRRFCLPVEYFVIVVFVVTFALIFQALFQHRLTSNKNLTITAFLSIIQAVVGYFIYRYWGLNFYTGGIMLTVTYNLLWGTFHYHLDQSLTRRAVVEILLFTLLIAAMLFSVTNFKARLLDGCVW